MGRAPVMDPMKYAFITSGTRLPTNAMAMQVWHCKTLEYRKWKTLPVLSSPSGRDSVYSGKSACFLSVCNQYMFFFLLCSLSPLHACKGKPSQNVLWVFASYIDIASCMYSMLHDSGCVYIYVLTLSSLVCVQYVGACLYACVGTTMLFVWVSHVYALF